MLSATEDSQASDDRSVSAVVVNYNAGAYLMKCISTTLAQVDEVLVVDNASTDGSLDLLSHHFPAEPRLKLIRNDKNLGFAAACNIGANQASGESILFLNPDCTLDDNAVSTLIQVLQSDPSVGMVGGLLINRDGSEQGGAVGQYLRLGVLLYELLGCIVLVIAGPGCFSIFISTINLYLCYPLKLRQFPVRA